MTVYTREMGTICPFAFFPCFTVFVASKLAIFPLKRSVLGAWKGHFRARKGQTVDLGFQGPRTWNAYKMRENVTTPQLASLHGLASNWAKNCHKSGEKTPKGQPSGPKETPWCRGAKIAAGQFLSLNCLAVTLIAGVILKEEQMPSLVGERQFWRHFRRQFGRG